MESRNQTDPECGSKQETSQNRLQPRPDTIEEPIRWIFDEKVKESWHSGTS
jgi:hypothetical protein